MMPAAASPPETANQDALRSLVKRANSGDREALVGLRQVLDEHPEVWRKIGDLATHAEETFVAAITGGDTLLAESVLRNAEDLKQSLVRPGATAAEDLAARRVVACWLQLQHADMMCARFSRSEPPEPAEPPAGKTPNRRPQPQQPADKPTLSPGEAIFWAKRQSQAARQYDAAMKLLLIVQQLQPGVMTSQVAEETGAPHTELRLSTEVA